MNSGMLALLSSETDKIESDVIESRLPDDSPFDTLTTTLRVDEELTLDGGVSAFVGRVGQERVERIEATNITEDGQITTNKTPEKIIRTTQFVLVPDEFVIVENSAGEFLFPLLNEETPHAAFPAEISVDGFTEDHPDAEYWKVGFKDRGDGAENGVLHGDAVFDDSDFGNTVVNSAKNQLGVQFDYDGQLLKLFLTESGYINHYGSDESEEFAELILNELLQYARIK